MRASCCDTSGEDRNRCDTLILDALVACWGADHFPQRAWRVKAKSCLSESTFLPPALQARPDFGPGTELFCPADKNGNVFFQRPRIIGRPPDELDIVPIL